MLLSIGIVVFLIERLFVCYRDFKFKITMVAIPFESTDAVSILRQILEEQKDCIYIMLCYVVIGIILQVNILLRLKSKP